MPNFTLIREYLGVSSPKNAKNCPNFQLFRPAGAKPLPDVHEICRVYAGNQSTKAFNIWCDSVSKLGIYRQSRDGAFPQKFSESPSSETVGWIEKIKGVQKWYEHPLSSCKVWWRSAAARRREKQKLDVFVFVCLFVTLWILNRGLVIQIAILSPFVGQF